MKGPGSFKMQLMATNLTADLLSGLDVALNESRWLDAVVRGNLGQAIALLEVLSLPEDGPEPGDPKLMLRLSRVGRVAASLRKGHWGMTMTRNWRRLSWTGWVMSCTASGVSPFTAGNSSTLWRRDGNDGGPG